MINKLVIQILLKMAERSEEKKARSEASRQNMPNFDF